MSNWLDILKEECTKSSQAKVGALLRKSQADGFPSGTVINQVLKAKYPGRTERLKALVEGVYMSASVQCPVVDEIPADQCIHYQNQPFSTANPTRIKLFHACRNGCPYSNIKE